MKQNYITLFFYDKKTMLTILQLIKFYIKRYILNLRCSVLYCFLFTLLVCACKEKTNEEKIREGKVSPEELINEIALKKTMAKYFYYWSSRCIQIYLQKG